MADGNTCWKVVVEELFLGVEVLHFGKQVKVGGVGLPGYSQSFKEPKSKHPDFHLRLHHSPRSFTWNQF